MHMQPDLCSLAVSYPEPLHEGIWRKYVGNTHAHAHTQSQPTMYVELLLKLCNQRNQLVLILLRLLGIQLRCLKQSEYGTLIANVIDVQLNNNKQVRVVYAKKIKHAQKYVGSNVCLSVSNLITLQRYEMNCFVFVFLNAITKSFCKITSLELIHHVFFELANLNYFVHFNS